MNLHPAVSALKKPHITRFHPFVKFMFHDLPHAPATSRNREPIRTILHPWLQQSNLVLEIASGTGEHTAWLAPQYPNLQWLPSDRAIRNLPTIDAYNANNPNVHSAIQLDVTETHWPTVTSFDLIFCVNMLHISPWEATLGLFTNARSKISDTGVLYIYGPFNKNGEFTSNGNRQFHHSLQAQNPQWGIRHMEEVIQVAESSGWIHQYNTDMPANNMSFVFSPVS